MSKGFRLFLAIVLYVTASVTSLVTYTNNFARLGAAVQALILYMIATWMICCLWRNFCIASKIVLVAIAVLFSAPVILVSADIIRRFFTD